MEKTKGLDAFRKQIETIATHGVLSMSIALGLKLKLFDALAKVASEEEPKSARDVADAAGMKERYVQEWLNTMACASIIEMTESGDKYWIPKERINDLSSSNPHAMVAHQLFLPIFGRVFDQICQVFEKSGPLGMEYESYTDFYRVMDKVSHAKHQANLIGEFLPLTGLTDKLKSGATVLDVGCGSGFHIFHLAENFPNSNFTGVDVSLDAVISATQGLSTEGKGLHNAAFIQKDARQLSEEWTEKFDWVSIFDACHDQQRPDLALKEIHRVLKPGGVFTMLEINGTSNPHTDQQEIGLLSAYLYGVSMFHCLPVGSNSKDALCLGTMWGTKRAAEMLEAAGFTDIQVIPTPFFAINVLYLCKKAM
uniref:Methyltransferase domain-containing protein n=1 Tax=Plectus sambesii TaxID=2011161 RepID=A0A914WFB6_9BILA